MSEIWRFKCLKCDEESECGLNHGDKILLNLLKHVDAIKSLLDNDKDGYIELSILGSGSEPIGFLTAHYGEGHDVVILSEYGKIKKIGDIEKKE